MATRVLRTIDVWKLPARQSGLVYARDPGEDASQDWLAGAPLLADSSTKEIKEDSASGTAPVLGVAQADATGDAGAEVPYIEANSENLFQGSVINDTSAVALAVDHLKTQYGLIDASGAWYIDVSNTTEKKVQIIEPIDDIGDTNARVVFRFLTDEQQNVLAST